MTHDIRSPHRTLVRLLIVFLALSVADLYLTWRLIQQGDGRLLESNPVASYWLATFGWGGMALFKLVVVALVGAAAWLVARRRPHTGDMILVFACGAQSAVVVYSIFLPLALDDRSYGPTEVVWVSPVNANASADASAGSQRAPGPPPLRENGMILLLSQKSVQEELKLTPAQIKDLAQLSGGRMELRQSFRRISTDDANARAQKLQTQEKSFLDGLQEEQAERLQQIAWQQRGGLALIDADVSDALMLSDEQKEKVQAVVNEAFRQRGGPRPRHPWNDAGKPQDDVETLKQKALALLTAEQSARWKEMLGEPFKGELRLWPGGPGPGPGPGPGRDGRRPRF
jgi:hypothetical protein